MKKKKLFTIVVAFILTFFATRIIIGIVAGDFAYSVIPGWHTIIYPPEMTLNVLTGIVLILTLLVVGLYKVLSILVATVLDRIISRKD